MKQYLLFAGDQYYPLGGWQDFQCSYDTCKAAVGAAADLKKDWWHVVDSVDGCRVYGNDLED